MLQIFCIGAKCLFDMLENNLALKGLKMGFNEDVGSRHHPEIICLNNSYAGPLQVPLLQRANEPG